MTTDFKLTAIHQPQSFIIGTDPNPQPMTATNTTAPPSLDPKGAAGKLKPQLQLIPPIINVEMAKALDYGVHRAGPAGVGYGPWNWRTANVESMTYVGAIRRHLDAYLEGQDLDESGAHHLGHIAASCAILLDAARHGTLVDNRPPTGSA